MAEIGQRKLRVRSACLGHLYGKFKEIYGQKLRSIILLHLGLVTLRFHYWTTVKPLIFMISGLMDASMTTKTNYSFWRHPDTSNNSRQPRFIFNKYMFEPIVFISGDTRRPQHFGNRSFWNFRNIRAPEIPEGPSDELSKSWIWAQYVLKAWDRHLVI